MANILRPYQLQALVATLPREDKRRRRRFHRTIARDFLRAGSAFKETARYHRSIARYWKR